MILLDKNYTKLNLRNILQIKNKNSNMTRNWKNLKKMILKYT